MTTKKNLLNKNKILVIIVVALFINLPLISAFELSNIRTEGVTENSAAVKWDTDDPADSFLSYGDDKENLQKIGDAKKVTEHLMLLDNLAAEKEYYYKVESNDVVDDNSGNLYSFSTLAPDITPPELVVDLPAMVPGAKFDLVGWAEPGAEVNLYVNNALAGSTVAINEEDLGKSFGVEEAVISEEELAEEELAEEEVTEEEEEVVEEEVVEEEEAVIEEPVVEEILENTSEEDTAVEDEIEMNESGFENQTLTGEAFSFSEKEEEIIKPKGKFEFVNVFVEKNKENTIKIEAIDSSGNKAEFSGKVFSDSSKPELEMEELPEISDDNLLEIKGTISEESKYEIFVNEKSVAEGEGKEIKESISLDEGENNIKIVVKDVAGWETIEEFEIFSDTQAPTITFKIEKGSEYYQGKMLTPTGGYKSRAQSDIHGETEPGANVYLYVYRPIGYEYNPSFDKARAKVTADQNGSFTFEEVDFEDEPLSLKDLAPKEVPSGLLQFSVFPIQQIAEQQQFSYYVFVIAEDKSGKSGYAQTTVTLHSCYSANLDFDIQSLAQFQRPLRLDPGLLDDGREEATAVFNLTYRGDGVPKTDYATGTELEKAFEVSTVTFDRACTQSMMDDESTKLGCNILPPYPRAVSNGDRTAWYTTFDLHSAEKLSDRDSDFWNEFKKRQIVFPLKLRVSYRERGPDGNFGPMKTQTSCFDLSYFIDIPLDSKEMLPDWLADEGLATIQWTVDLIDDILPYLEDAILVAGVSCIASFLLRMVVRWIRIFYAKYESYSSTIKKVAGSVSGGDDGESKEDCPVDQSTLLLESTIDHWSEEINELYAEQPGADPNTHSGIYGYKEEGKEQEWANKDYSLDNLCSKTAGMWKAEAVLDQAYKWTCDRVFCRAVPAGWTSTKEKEQVDTVILKQQQCTISSQGVPLQEVENCQEVLESNANYATYNDVAVKVRQKGISTCYRYNDRLYVDLGGSSESIYGDGEIRYLDLVYQFGRPLDVSVPFTNAPNRLIAYRPPNAKNFIVAQDKSCKAACKNPNRQGYKNDVDGGISNIANENFAKDGRFGCYLETKQGKNIALKGDKGEITGPRYSGGYTSDCFINLEKGSGALSGQTSGDFGCQTDQQCKDQFGTDYFCNPTTLKCGKSGFAEALEPAEFNIKEPTGDQTGLMQCVCVADEKKEDYSGVRTAAKEVGETKEDWVYRQAALFREEQGTRGTYYPEWRYYTKRDLSSAFGADYLTDYFKPDGEEEIHEINPHTQFLGVYQTVCLSGARAHLIMLKSILEGLGTCIEEAKHTGLRDAGVCKTIFAQHVCGLIYKVLAYFNNDCSPIGMSDQKKSEGGSLDKLGFSVKAGISSISDAMSTSIDDIKQDYGNAQLNQYFATGVQGFTQSICMAAFGYDWPLGMDFILDSAYAFQTKTTVMVFPAEREQATFNPQKGTAVYNYNVGALVFPGCKIKNANVYLKCVGPEDQGHPGIQCAEQGCDCLHVSEFGSAVEGEKTKQIEQGRLFDIKQGSMTDMEIPSPQKIDSNYRYDHVVVDLQLDPYEDAENCFDEGYRDGKFYFPITDISPPAEFVCQVQVSSGRYFCPQVQEMFGGGVSAYLESPYMSCYDDQTDSWTSCKTPGLFTKGDQIRVKVHVLTDGGEYCLKTHVVGVPELEGDRAGQPLPKNLPGPYAFEVFGLGSVTDNFFAGSSTNLVLASPPLSAAGCSPSPIPVGTISPAAQQKLYTFRYEVVGNQYQIYLPEFVSVSTPGYQVNDQVSPQGGYLLLKSGQTSFDSSEIRQIIFQFPDGFQYKNLIGEPHGTVNKCVYQVTKPLAHAQNQKSITVKAELFQADAGGSCYNAKTPVNNPAFGKREYTENILVQLDTLVSQQTSKLHQLFKDNKCSEVLQETDQNLRREQNDIEDALAIYYTAACYIVQGGDGWKTQQQSKNAVCNMLDVFFNRHYVAANKYGTPYPEDVKNTVEFKKIEKYLTEIQNEINCEQVKLEGQTSTSVPTPTPSPATKKNTCSHPNAKFNIVGITEDDPNWKPDNWSNYVCRKAAGTSEASDGLGKFELNNVCWARGKYSTEAEAISWGVDWGCGSGVELCCPPLS
jgi:hypothetical protein